jgi:hypothetical protein
MINAPMLTRATIAATSWLLVSAAHAQAPLQLTVDGGLACSKNRAIGQLDATTDVGVKGCGGTGGVELARTGAPVAGFFDHWALRGRFTQFDQSKTSAAGTAGLSFDDERVVLDAELGRKIDLFGRFLPGGTSRLTLGVRYAAWEGTRSRSAGPAAGPLAEIGRETFETEGFGPRIGLRSSFPLAANWMVESRSGVAALFASHKREDVVGGIAVGRASSSNPVYSFESAMALTYLLRGTETGPALSVGYLSEYWFRQTDVDGFTRNRHSAGPFARVRVPLQ